MKAQKLKQGMDWNRTVMYWFDHSRDIILEEEQPVSKTLDRVVLHYTVKDGEKAYFSNEYVPVGMSRKATKKPDITAMLESGDRRMVKWYIYDIKDTVINMNTVLKLCSQWHSGIAHIEEQYLSGLYGYGIERSLGVITRYWSSEKLQEEKERYQEKINQAKSGGLLTARKSQAKLNEYRQKIKAVQYILDGVFIDNESYGEERSYDIHYISMARADETTYTAEMNIEF